MVVNLVVIDRILKDERGYIDEEIYLDYLVLIIAQIADEGDTDQLSGRVEAFAAPLAAACRRGS